MGPLPSRWRTTATLLVLALLLLGAATLQAAIGARQGPAASRVMVSTSGSMSLFNSREGAAIFALENIGPGEGGTGEVTVENAGTLPGTLALVPVDPSDMPGTYGGLLSARLELRLEDVSSGTASQLYDGRLSAMPEMQLGEVKAGESRTYRFLVAMLDGGAPSSPWADDNLYQRASMSLGYEWILTEVEGGSGPGGPSQPPAAPIEPPPVGPAPPAGLTSGAHIAGTPHADHLTGTLQDDVILGLGGADRIFGLGGSDILDGGPGADRLYGGAGADRLRGGPGSDHLNGGAGDDVSHARDGQIDFVSCGAGRDRAYVDERDRVRGCESIRP
jgi:RTX calcium-binding nonapeptide repeat (4 copies)